MGGRATSSWCPSMEDLSAQAVRKHDVEKEMHLQQEAHAIAGAVVDRQHGLRRELTMEVEKQNDWIDRVGYVAVSDIVETGIQRYLYQLLRVGHGVWKSHVLHEGLEIIESVLQ